VADAARGDSHGDFPVRRRIEVYLLDGERLPELIANSCAHWVAIMRAA
jgi:hypothetical protein